MVMMLTIMIQNCVLSEESFCMFLSQVDQIWDLGKTCNLIYVFKDMMQLCSGITRCRVLNGELYAQSFQKLIYWHLFTGCLLNISLQTSEQTHYKIRISDSYQMLSVLQGETGVMRSLFSSSKIRHHENNKSAKNDQQKHAYEILKQMKEDKEDIKPEENIMYKHKHKEGKETIWNDQEKQRVKVALKHEHPLLSSQSTQTLKESGRLALTKRQKHQASKQEKELLAYLHQKMNKSFLATSRDHQLLAYGPAYQHIYDIPPPPESYNSYYQQALRNVALHTAETIRVEGLSHKSENCSQTSSREALGDYFLPRSKLCAVYDSEAEFHHREIFVDLVHAEIYDKKTVTLVTQLSEDRLSTLERIVQHWKGK